jgi:phospholipase D1/2
MFDYNFSVDYGKFGTGYDKGITLNSTNRVLTLEALDKFQFFDFLYSLK